MVKLLRPVSSQYPIGARFGQKGPHWDPREGHRGVDFRCPTGTPVSAAASGKVLLAATGGPVLGTHVRLSHEGGLQTLYAHLSSLSVEKGEIVAQGRVIGLSGNTGLSTGPHLHFGVYRGLAVNPEDYLVEASFSDVPPERWSFDAIEWCRSRGLLTGLPDGTFGPDRELTREQMAVVARRLALMLGHGE